MLAPPPALAAPVIEAKSLNLVFETGDVTWRRSKDGVDFNLPKLLADHPEYQEAYAIPKPGSRRFLVNVAKG